MYIDTITLFCRYDNNGIKFRPYILRGVDLNIDRQAILTKLGTDTGDKARLHIKGYDKINGLTVVNQRDYTGDASTITITSGDDFSFFIEGEYPSTVIDDEDYTEGFFNELQRERDVYAVTNVARYSVIPHFEVTAR